MSDHDQHHQGGPQQSDLGPVESSTLSPKPVLLFLMVLGISTAFVFFVVKGLDWGFKTLDFAGEGQTETQVTGGRTLPPEPLLQGAPGEGNVPTALPLDAMENLRTENEQKLGSFGWVDKPGGIARIPIERAKEMIVDRGLPTMTSPAISEELRKAETVRKQVFNAGSSGGQLIQSRAQNPQPAQRPQQPEQNEMKQQVPPQQ